MCLRSVGSALNLNTPDGAELRRTGCGRASTVLLPSRVGVAVRVVAAAEAILLEVDMML